MRPAISSMTRNSTRLEMFIIQWHITERCNWRCHHCYQDNSCKPPDLNLNQLLHILDNCLSLNIDQNKKIAFSITGGEPMIRKDFFKFAEKLAHNLDSCGYVWRILSNGSFVTKENASRLKDLNLQRFQVSMEGMEKTNDSIRGKGAFNKTVNSIKTLVKSKVPVSVSFTLTKQNISDVFPLASFLKSIGVATLGVRRFVPIGTGSQLKKNTVTSEELRELYLKILEFNKKTNIGGLIINTGCESAIFNEDLLADNFTTSTSNRFFHSCGVSVGKCFTIMSNGDIVACRRMPIKIGNALKDNIYDIYCSDTMVKLRDVNKANSRCKNCSNFSSCLGGAKCITYAYTGKWNMPDPQCWKIKSDSKLTS